MKKSLLIQTAAALMIAAIALMGCKKDDDPVTDYRDGFEGTYITDVSGSLFLTDLDIQLPLSGKADIIVLKSSNSRMLTLNYDGDNVGNGRGRRQPANSIGKRKNYRWGDGVAIIMDVTISYTGTITGRKLTLIGSISGNATVTFTDEEGTFNSNSAVTGTVIYSGTK